MQNRKKDPLVAVLKYLAAHNPAVFASFFNNESLDELSPQSAAIRHGYLDPQPLPSRYYRLAAQTPAAVTAPSAFEAGLIIANDFLYLAWTASRLGLDANKSLDLLDDVCGNDMKPLPLPPVRHDIPPTPPPEWRTEFRIGILFRLCAVTGSDKATTSVVAKAIDKVSGHLENTLGQLSN